MRVWPLSRVVLISCQCLPMCSPHGHTPRTKQLPFLEAGQPSCRGVPSVAHSYLPYACHWQSISPCPSGGGRAFFWGATRYPGTTIKAFKITGHFHSLSSWTSKNSYRNFAVSVTDEPGWSLRPPRACRHLDLHPSQAVRWRPGRSAPSNNP